MNKNFFFSVILVMVLVFGMMVVGCDLDLIDNKVIDAKFIGKWEVQSFVYQGTTYNIPVTINGTPITSVGYEITETSVKTYGNGIITQNVEGLYSDGNSFYNSAGQSGFTMEVNGIYATIKTLEETDYCTKVTKFSWE